MCLTLELEHSCSVIYWLSSLVVYRYFVFFLVGDCYKLKHFPAFCFPFVVSPKGREIYGTKCFNWKTLKKVKQIPETCLWPEQIHVLRTHLQNKNLKSHWNFCITISLILRSWSESVVDDSLWCLRHLLKLRKKGCEIFWHHFNAKVKRVKKEKITFHCYQFYLRLRKHLRQNFLFFILYMAWKSKTFFLYR